MKLLFVPEAGVFRVADQDVDVLERAQCEAMIQTEFLFIAQEDALFARRIITRRIEISSLEVSDISPFMSSAAQVKKRMSALKFASMDSA